MRVGKPALSIVREYAAERGCTQLDEHLWRFVAPDRSRAIKIKEIQHDKIYVFDTAKGMDILWRDERRPHQEIKPVTQSMETAEGGPCGRPRHKGLPVTRERVRKTVAPMGQMTLAL